MPYKFTFDISKAPQHFFIELAIVSNQMGMQKIFEKTLQGLIRKFRIQEVTGLNIQDAVVLIQDLLKMQTLNLIQKQEFLQTKKRALFLPHCCRKYMDSQCQAVFEPSLTSYVCAHCSPDCFVNKAERIAREKGYDVYVLSGGSCMPNILKQKKYEGVVGVACGPEVMMSGEKLSSMGMAWQSVPLLKNGCANTFFNMETLIKTL
ncbi:MAG: DUF116 domain-containing protein [Candidatus Bathyarchaeia archaeon]|jgi:hypothetical protein